MDTIFGSNAHEDAFAFAGTELQPDFDMFQQVQGRGDRHYDLLRIIQVQYSADLDRIAGQPSKDRSYDRSAARRFLRTVCPFTSQTALFICRDRIEPDFYGPACNPTSEACL